ncbi:MAG: hypothetical protein GC202_02215 [Alphaproteobacteria bacterium]|nr:hypothetical protein [Alphaproteobacteria bacterium]
MARIYVASSWRNPHQPGVVEMLRARNHAVYDFRNPPNKSGFSWQQVNGSGAPSVDEYRKMLAHPIAASGYLSDFRAMEWADTCILVLPCGRSAHLEAGWFAGRGKRVIILTRDGEEPELMALMAQHICGSMAEVLDALTDAAVAA